MSVTKKQKDFCHELMECGNKAEAARKAGYSEKTAPQMASENLKKPNVREYLRHLEEQVESEKVATIKEIQEFYTSVMRGEINDQFGLEVSIDTRMAAGRELMKRIELTEKTKAGGEGITIINNIPRPEGKNGKQRKHSKSN